MKKKEKKLIPEIGGKGGKPARRQTVRSGEGKEMRVLILEDSAADAELMEFQLEKDGIDFVSQRVDTRNGFLQALKAFKPDLILADYKLPKFDALQALALRKKMAPQVPFIIVTGSISEEIAVECMKQGADDYLLKDRLARLGEAVRHALTNRGLQAEKMAAEEALRASKRLYHTFIDSSNDMAFLKDDRFRHLLANRALCDFYGKPENEIIGKTDSQLMEKTAAQRCLKSDQLALAENRIHISEETVSDRTFETRKFPVKLASGLIGVGGYIRDISASKSTQEMIEQSAKKWTTTFDAIRDGIALLAVDQTIRQANQAFADQVNKPFREIIGKKCYELVHPDRQPDPHCPFAKMQISKKRESMELALNDRIFEILVDPITNAAGALSGAAHIITDITEHKRAEQTLRTNEAQLSNAMVIAKLGYWEYDVDDDLFIFNDHFYDIFHTNAKKVGGYKMSPERYAKQFVHPDDIPIVGNEIRKAIETTDPNFSCQLEHRIIYADGEIGYISVRFFIVKDSHGRTVKTYGANQDITERKRAGEALRESEEHYRDLVEKGNIAIVVDDIDGNLIYFNNQFLKLFGYSAGEIEDKTHKDFIHPDSLKIVSNYHQKHMQGEKTPSRYEFKGIRKDGSRINVEIDVCEILKKAGKISGTRSYMWDITERKNMENELKDSEIRYHNLFENSSEFIYTLDLKGNFTDVNKAALALTGYTKSELLKMNFKDYTPKKDHRKLFLVLSNIYKTGKPLQNLLIEAIIKDKSKKYFETSISLMKKGEQIIGFQGSSKDITERKQAEEQIQASLLEKEVLLKEIHHRVKNNLQIISGLLTLQAAQIDDERLQHIIKDSQSRIWTMALIHQTLYQSGNLAAIDMAEYIRSLVGNLLSSHAQVALPPTVIFDLLPLRLSIDKAIPLALIINELVTNAMKHAFPDGRPGEIRIGLHECRDKSRLVPTENMGTARRAPTEQDNAQSYELTVADNGTGLPPGFDAATQKSLGLQLVTMLVKQLGGSLAFASKDGTSVNIGFSNNEKNEKQS